MGDGSEQMVLFDSVVKYLHTTPVSRRSGVLTQSLERIAEEPDHEETKRTLIGIFGEISGSAELENAQTDAETARRELSELKEKNAQENTIREQEAVRVRACRMNRKGSGWW